MRKLTLAAIILAASFAAVIAILLVYPHYFQPYAYLVVAQVDPKHFEPYPQFAQFSELQDQEQVFKENPKLQEAFGNVQRQFERIMSDCPPRQVVYCNLESNMTVTAVITAKELHSLLQSPDLNFYGTILDEEWIAFVTRDGNDCYSTIPINEDEFATKYSDGSQKCYYTIKLERIYDNGPQQSPSQNVVLPVK